MRRLRLAASLLVLVLLAGCAGARLEPIHDVQAEPIPAPSRGLTRDQIGGSIVDAMAHARWHVDALEPGRLWATFDVIKHAATVKVSWTERDYSIEFVSSTNLLESGGEIHRTYNTWVANLQREINDTLYRSPAAAGVAPPPAVVAMAAPRAPASVPAPSFGDPVPFACPRPGTEIDFRSGNKRVFGTADGIFCPYESAGQRRRATPFGAYGGDAAQALARLWPLKLGNQVSFQTRSGQTTSSERFYVTRRVPVTVAAGTFDAFLIDWDASASGLTAAYSEHGQFWYAPEVGYVVKVKHQLTAGSYPRLADDEAVRIVPQQ